MAHCWVLNQRAHRLGHVFREGGVCGWWFVGFGCPASDYTVGSCGLVGGCWLGLLFGNCIVDASILRGKHVYVCSACIAILIDPHHEALFLWCWFSRKHNAHVELTFDMRSRLVHFWWVGWLCVCKFLRAHGGCLGIGSRRRTWESAISLVESITGR